MRADEMRMPVERMDFMGRFFMVPDVTSVEVVEGMVVGRSEMDPMTVVMESPAVFETMNEVMVFPSFPVGPMESSMVNMTDDVSFDDGVMVTIPDSRRDPMFVVSMFRRPVESNMSREGSQFVNEVMPFAFDSPMSGMVVDRVMSSMLG